MNGADESSPDISPTLFDTAMYERLRERTPWPTPRVAVLAGRAPATKTHGWDLPAAVKHDGTLFNPSTSSAAASPASPSRTLAGDWVPKTNAGSGPNSYASFAKLNPDGSWSKMYLDSFQSTLDGSFEEYLQTWPRAGSMRNGTAFLQPPSAPITSGIGSSSWPTPVANENARMADAHGHPTLLAVARWPTPTAGMADRGDRGDLNTSVKGYDSPSGHTKMRPSDEPEMYPTPRTTGLDGGSNSRKAAKEWGMWPTPTTRDRGSDQPFHQGGPSLSGSLVGGQLNPTWVEWLMGFPLGWTDLGDSGTPSSRRSRNTSGG